MSELWKELHIRALKIKINDQRYLNKFALRIPRYTMGCQCKESWNQWVRMNPPTFGNDYFTWTVNAHNAINKKLNKKEFTIEEARTLYI